MLHISSEEFQLDKVTITVEWVQQFNAIYKVKVMPAPQVPIFFKSTSCQLTILYNTEYNLSVEAFDLCKNATSMIGLNYGTLFLKNLMLLKLVY